MKFFLPIVLFAFLISCQKGIEDINPPIRTTQNDSILVSQLIELDSTAGTRPDTISKALYFYDNQKRLSHGYVYVYTNGVPDTSSKGTFYYNLNDTLPYKQVEIFPDVTGLADTMVNYYNFANGKLVYDSSVNRSSTGISIEVRKISYYANKIVDTFLHYSPNGTQLSKGYETINFQVVNGLLMSQKDTIFFDYANPGSNTVGTATHTFLYDNHPNPFNILKPLFPYSNTEDNGGSVLSFEKNNVLEVRESYVSPSWGSANYHYKNVYQYNSNGYPAVVTITDQNNPSVVRKYLYIYTK